MMNSRPSRVQGFSLVELMVVIAIVGVLMGVAVPALRDLLVTQKMKSAALDVLTTVMFAKGEAMKRGTDISIKAPSNDFNNGWCVIFGTAADCDPASPATGVMYIQPAISTLAVDWIFPASGSRVITFNRAGRMSSHGQVRFRVSDPAGAGTMRCVNINVSGGVTQAAATSGTC